MLLVYEAISPRTCGALLPPANREGRGRLSCRNRFASDSSRREDIPAEQQQQQQ